MSLEAWDDVWRRNQHLTAGLIAADADRRVLFVEPPDDPLHALRSGRRPEWGHGLRAVPGTPRLRTYRPVKWLPRRLDPRADERLARRVAHAAQRLGMTSPVLWINDPAAAAIARETGWPVVYDITDDWLAAERDASTLRRLAADESWLLWNAREVIACSAEIVRRKTPQRPVGGNAIALIPNAVDTAAYRTPVARPGDLPAGACAVYVGTLHSDRLDVGLTADTARRLHGIGSLVLVGPNVLSERDTHELRDAGAVILGSRPRDAVIGYLQHADALVVPHVVDAFTESLDPIKLYEYQAAGRPIVSTPVAGFRDAAGGLTTIASGDSFADAVAAALSHDDAPPTEASEVADWTDRVRAVRAVLERIPDDD